MAENTFFAPECVIPNFLWLGQKKPLSYDICPTSKCNGLALSTFSFPRFYFRWWLRHVLERDGHGSSESYLRGGAPPHCGTAEVWGQGRGGFLSRQSVTQVEAFFVLLFPFFQASKVLYMQMQSGTAKLDWPTHHRHKEEATHPQQLWKLSFDISSTLKAHLGAHF